MGKESGRMCLGIEVSSDKGIGKDMPGLWEARLLLVSG